MSASFSGVWAIAIVPVFRTGDLGCDRFCHMVECNLMRGKILFSA
jgi:hypothetical protein